MVKPRTRVVFYPAINENVLSTDTSFTNSPTIVFKSNVNRSYNNKFSPFTSYNSSYDYSSDFSPTNIRQTYRTNKFFSNTSPKTYQSFYSDYAPYNYRSNDIRYKYAPFTDYQYYNRYSPSLETYTDYKPVLVSRFKPQPVIVNNRKTLRDYFDYVLGLLTILG